LEHAFAHVGLDWRAHVEVDERFLRPADAAALVGNASRAADAIGWHAQTDVAALARLMVDADLAAIRAN
ncbi:GDP-mannose 4,6-dehydratase, partial [Sphingomonas sp. HMWF008]